MNYKKHNIKSIVKFIVATLSSPTMYLNKRPGENQFKFVKDIEGATKIMNKKDAEYIVHQYHYYTGDEDLELVVLPLIIEYSLVEEI